MDRLALFPTSTPAIARQRCRMQANGARVPGLWSVIIPSYNRLPILKRCVHSLDNQRLPIESTRITPAADGPSSVDLLDYEVVVVDDGSTDGTVEFFEARISEGQYQRVQVYKSSHAGAARARNIGVARSKGSVIVFLDSDMIVMPNFLAAHYATLMTSADSAFSYGRVVNTDNWDDPTSEPFKLTDRSAAFFATGNVAIRAKQLLDCCEDDAGPFDTNFSTYGWEDLELGERLRQKGATITHAGDAIGYHYNPPFSADPEFVSALVKKEKERGYNGAKFLAKHNNLRVRLMIQLTPFHYFLWWFLTFGTLISERTLMPVTSFAQRRLSNPQLAAALLSPVLNWHTVSAVHQAWNEIRNQHQDNKTH